MSRKYATGAGQGEYRLPSEAAIQGELLPSDHGARWPSSMAHAASVSQGPKTFDGRPKNLLGIEALSGIRQPNSYTCGPTAVCIVAKHFGMPNWITPIRLGRLAGTNPRTGTTEIEMAAALDALSFTWVRPRRSSTHELIRAVEDEQFILLRTGQLDGREVTAKHWLLMHGYNKDSKRFLIHCPSRGAMTLSAEEILPIWKCRDYDHFQLGMRPVFHPRLLQMHEKTLPLYAKPLARAVPDIKIETDQYIASSRMYQYMIGTCQKQFAEFEGPIEIPPRHFTKLAHSRDGTVAVYGILKKDRPSFLGSAPYIIGVDLASKCVVGLITAGAPFVPEALRGRGIGRSMIRALLENPVDYRTESTSFSVLGFHNRIAAWKESVDMAIEAGADVPEYVKTQRNLLPEALAEVGLASIFPAYRRYEENLRLISEAQERISGQAAALPPARKPAAVNRPSSDSFDPKM